MTPHRDDGIGIVILAGGAATRLPGKLTLDAGGVPLLVRVYRNVTAGRPAWISARGGLPPAVDAALDAPIVVDRRPGGGPLAGLVATLAEVTTPWVFACAGDAPFVDAAFVDRLAGARRPGDEAVVPAHVGGGAAPRLEPLAALYERAAFRRAALPVLLEGDASVRAVVARLRARIVPLDDPHVVMNVNTPADYAAAFGAHA